MRRALLLLPVLAGCASESLPLGAGLSFPDLVDFGEVPLGLTASRVVVLENRADYALSVTLRAAGDFAPASHAFSIEGAKSSLQPGERLALTLRFEPFVPGLAESSFDAITELGTATVRVRAAGREAFRVEPSSIDFGSVARGDRRTIAVAVTNLFGAELPLSTAFEGTADVFSLGPTETAIPAGASVSLEVTYAPSLDAAADVNDVGRLVVSHCSGHPLCSARVALSGRATADVLRCAPAELHGPALEPGERYQAEVTCTAVPGVRVVVERVVLQGGVAPFSLRAPALPVELAGGALAFTVIAEWAPGTPNGPAFDNVLVSAHDAEFRYAIPELAIPVDVTIGRACIHVWPGALDFGRVALGTRLGRTLMISNDCYADLVLSSIVTDHGAFTVAAGPAVLAPGSSTVVTVSFASDQPGPAAGTLRIASNDASQPEVRVPLTGEGVDLGDCTYRMYPSAHDFGAVPAMRTKDADVWIENVGSTSCLVRDPQMLPGSSLELALGRALPADMIIPPGAMVPIPIRFSPESMQSAAGELGFYISSRSRSMIEVPLSGAATGSELLVTPDVLDFGRLDATCAPPLRAIELYNHTSTTAEVLEVALEHPSGRPEVFELIAPPLPFVIPSGGRSTLAVTRADPAPAGTHVARLVVRARGQPEPYIIALSGTFGTALLEEERFTSSPGPTDVLLVIDNSSSMIEELPMIDAALLSFDRSAMNGADFRAAIIGVNSGADPCLSTAQPQAPAGAGACGFAGEAGGRRIVEDDTQPSPAEALSAIFAAMPQVGPAERGLEAADRALRPERLLGWNSGLVRPDHDLAVVYVSDDEDESAGELAYYQASLAAMKGARRKERLAVHTLGGPCPTADETLRYQAMALALGGEVEDVCALESGMERIADNIFGRRRHFLLAQPAADLTIEVEINGAIEQRWTYDRGMLLLDAAAVPTPGTEIVVRYRQSCP